MLKELPDDLWVSVVSGFLGTNELLKVRELNVGGKEMFEKMVTGRKKFLVMKVRMPFVRRDVQISKLLRRFMECSKQRLHHFLFLDYIKEYKVTFVSGISDQAYDFYKEHMYHPTNTLTYKERMKVYREFEELTNQWTLELFPKMIQRFKKLLYQVPRYLWEYYPHSLEPDISIEIEGYIPMNDDIFRSLLHDILYSYKNKLLLSHDEEQNDVAHDF
jgi:hypothetical protein